MTTYAGSIDKTEPKQGVKFSALVGLGGVTAGQPVMWDGSTANTVIACTASSDACIGLARDTVSAAGAVTVLGNGCLVLTPYTLTVGTKVGVGSGVLVDWSVSGTVAGTTVTGASSASVVRVQIQY